MATYAAQLLESLDNILAKSITENHEPLQIASLSLIGTVADVIKEDFQPFFNTFIQKLVSLLQTVAGETMEAKKLRARAIQTIGSIITSISDNEDKEPFRAHVLEITQHLSQTLQSRLPDDDPQDEMIKDTLAQCAGFLGQDFNQFMPMLLDQLITDTKLEIDFKMESADLQANNDNMSL